MVIGGTHGIGLAIAEELAYGGAQVTVTGRDADRARAAEARLGPGSTAIVGDVTDHEHLASLAARAGDLDALFVNVGIAEPEPPCAVTEVSWDRHFAVNAKGPSSPRRRSRRGSAQAAASCSPRSSPKRRPRTVILASKAAVRAFSRSLAADLVRRDVRVNTVAPGFIDTPTLGVAGASESERAELGRAGRAITPMGRLGTPAEVARAAVFLALEATFTTGSELQVDGGLSEIEVPA